MADRNDHYIPTAHDGGPIEPTFNTLVGDPLRDKAPDVMPVALGSADHLNDKRFWWWAQVADGPDEHWSRFDGWDVRIGLDLRTWNEREVNDWKGRDEIRKTGYWHLKFNEQVVHGGYVRGDPLETLIKIRQIVKDMQALPIDWRDEVADYRTLIEGRKVYYKTTPATLGYWMPTQGAIMVTAIPGASFPRSPYDIDREPDSPEHDYSEEFKHEAKVDLLDRDIWWWRERG